MKTCIIYYHNLYKIIFYEQVMYEENNKIIIPIEGVAYALPYQQEFRGAVEQRDYRAAADVLKKIPVPGRQERVERIHRSALMIHAYALLVEAMLQDESHPSACGSCSLDRALDLAEIK